VKRKNYERELRPLQTELCRLQEWVVHKGLRVIVVFEGRDAAGKGGTIKAITERVSPRVFRLVALPAVSSRSLSLPCRALAGKSISWTLRGIPLGSLRSIKKRNSEELPNIPSEQRERCS
jgi:hypothetical protein